VLLILPGASLVLLWLIGVSAVGALFSVAFGALYLAWALLTLGLLVLGCCCCCRPSTEAGPEDGVEGGVENGVLSSEGGAEDGIITGEDGSSGGGTTGIRFLDIALGLVAALDAVIAVTAFVAAGYTYREYAADYILLGVLSLAAMVILAVAALALTSVNPVPRSNGTTAGAGLLMALLLVLQLIALWSLCALTGRYTSPGMVGQQQQISDGGPAMHVYCINSRVVDPSLPTVVFLHGFLGSSLDASWVSSDPTFLAQGLRFCSLDRPGYGWSGPYNGDTQRRDFKYVAEITVEALQAAGVVGDVILLFHSLGGYWALSFAHAAALVPSLNIVGGVAADALTPEWHDFNTREQIDECGVNVPLEPGNILWFIVGTSTTNVQITALNITLRL